jgi:AKAP7 2'5' RNA ligase-like domain
MKPKSAPKTHFICLPLRSPAFRDKVKSFNALLPSTISPTIIRPTGSLHFTLGVLSLKTPEEIDSAVNFLHSCYFDAVSILQGRKLTVAMKGIASMQNNLRKANVIYAISEEGDGRLMSLCGAASLHPLS